MKQTQQEGQSPVQLLVGKTVCGLFVVGFVDGWFVCGLVGELVDGWCVDGWLVDGFMMVGWWMDLSWLVGGWIC